MSRAEFRGSVESPRPAAAWLMSVVASAALWITEQLPLWMIAVQLIAYAVSYQTRLDPPAWRRSAIWLNVGMLGVTTVTIRSALDGNPATISLAYFSALAQGLQLLDARPRKSEFLLVALALFQVILASNLTDSVLFPPLLVLFLASVSWTLLVHTLRMEAAEAGDANAARAVLGTDLRRTTAWATLACLVLALVLFMVLPRMKTKMLRSGLGSGLAVAGFSDRVALGEIGRIRQDDSVVLRIVRVDGPLPEPGEAYWRGLAFDRFDGRSWSVSSPDHAAGRRAVNGVGRFGIDLAERAEIESQDDATVTHRIVREPVEAGVLFTPGRNLRVEGPFQRIETDRNGGLYLPGRGDERVRYTVRARTPERSARALRADRAAPPIEPAVGGPGPALRYLALPDIDPRIEENAREIVRDARSDFDRAWQIQQHLREHGQYTDNPPTLGDVGTTPIEDFLLGELEGHCEYFASAMVVLARSQGLPSRLVNGFAGGLTNDVGNFIEVTRADAHAWVEVHFADAGWVRFDPTPPDLRLRANEEQSLWDQIAQVGGAIELWWFQRVVDFDSADQIGAMQSLWRGWQGAGDSNAKPDSTRKNRDRLDWTHPFEGFDPTLWLVPGGALLLWWGWRRRRPRTTDPVPQPYRRALRALQRRGWSRGPSVTARAFALRVEADLPDDAGQAFREITDAYLAERFGDHAPAPLDAQLATLEHAVKRVGLRNHAHVGEN